MLSFLPAPIKGTISATLFALNTIFWCPCVYLFALLKILMPTPSLKKMMGEMCIACAENWICFNSGTARWMHKIEWDVVLPKELSTQKSYLVSSNHQSWVDIVVLQNIFNRRIPFLRFFLKRELLYVPFLGIAWWALDFPFMKRHSADYLSRHPEKRGEDLLTTKKACEKFKGSPISVLNFLEGTRFTPQKHARQQSPYRFLLKPKAGGLAFVIEAMGDQFDSILDVTIAYPDGPISLWGLMSGRLDRVMVRVRQQPIPAVLLNKSYHSDPAHRDRIQTFVKELWDAKDFEVENLLRTHART